jgi:hypothetical protein
MQRSCAGNLNKDNITGSRSRSIIGGAEKPMFNIWRALRATSQSHVCRSHLPAWVV